jgi:amidase
LEATVQLCQDLGHELVEAVPPIDGPAFAKAFFTMVCGETRASIEEAGGLLARRPTAAGFEPATWVVGLLGTKISAAEFAHAVRYLKLASRQVGVFFEEYDVLLTPTLARPPFPTGELQPQGFEAVSMELLGRLNAASLIKAAANIEALAEQIFEFMPYTPLFNATGQPAMSVPLYWNDNGLPIGMQFVGRFADEATLFQLAGQLEAAKPWFDRVPPISRA